ncbi:hypothetical protein D7V51_09175 [Acinetobacter cumulans]|nr:hypothetical protein D7V51_09175 [Acinetobacter cumulans]
MTDDVEKPFRLITEYTIEQNSSLEKSFRLTLTVGDISDLDPVAPQYVLGLGFNSLSFASPKLAFTQFIKPAGLSFQSFGVHKAYNLRQIIKPSGLNASVFGSAKIYNGNQYLSVFGFSTQVFGSATLKNKNQKLIAAGFSNQAFGTAKLHNSRQYLAGSGFSNQAFGNAGIISKNQQTKVSGFNSSLFGLAKLYNLKQLINVSGFSASEFGNASAVNKNQLATVSGFNALQFGTTRIYNSKQIIAAPSLSPLAFGNPALLGGVRWIFATGTDSAQFGKPSVISLRRYLEAGGKDSSAFGSAQLDFKNRPVQTKGAAFNDSGTPRIEHGIRTVSVLGFSLSIVSSGGWVTFKTRNIAPDGIEAPAVGQPWVGGEQYIGPQGFDAARFGTRIIPEIQTISALGFTGAFGNAGISLKKRYLGAKGFLTAGNEDAQRWGYAKAWNLRQYIVQTFIHDSGLVPPEIVGWTAIANRNRTMQASGFVHSKFGHAFIENTGRDLQVKGFDAIAGLGQPRITHRVRKIKLDGIEAPYMSSWHIAYNTAAVLKPKGFNAQAFGNVGIENTRRNFQRIGNIESQAFGTAFIAYRIRTVSIEARYSIAPPPIRMPSVHLHTRYIDPVGGIDAFVSGFGEVFERWTKIAPKWALRDFFGTPQLHNVTPELRIFGHDSAEFGSASIRTQWRDVNAQGDTLTLFSKPVIAFRDRSFDFAGWHSMQFGRARLAKTAQPPFTDQRIWLDSISIDGQDYSGHGIKPPQNQVPAPGINQNVLYPSGIFRSVFGSPSVRSNVIQIQSGIQVLDFGSPAVGNRNRTIGVKGFEHKIEMGRPRMSPNIIYAVTEAPAQAQQNNPASGILHFVNSDGGNRAAGEVFGNATVTNRHRKLQNVSAWANLGLGHPSVFNRKSYIGVKGFTSYRAGWHVVGPFEQILEQFDSADFFETGHVSIQHRAEIGVDRIYVGAMNMQAFGGQRIELFNRSIGMQGYDALQMGTRLFGDGPFMWQGLRIGGLVSGNYGGFNAEKFGQAWISLKVREINPASFDTFRADYDHTRFDQRMKVKRIPLPPPPEQVIGALGFASSTLNTPNIGNKVHYIRPYGNGDNYRKGAPDAD